MTRIFSTLAAAGMAAAIAIGGAASVSLAQSQADVIKQRQAAMKDNGKEGKIIAEYAKSGKGSAKAVQAAAEKIVATAGKLTDLFPAGTSEDDAVGKAGKTRAKAAIWTDMAKFKADDEALKKAAEAVAKAAAAGDQKMVADASKELNAACGNCHKAFRGAAKK